ncbi:MAG: hypothetical protein PHW63_02135 [Alphaproteobacteria bacterium]|nr:hypothetical protein [Alphaproteobacteria bacterium]
MSWTEAQVKQIVEMALSRLETEQRYLLEHDASERAMVFHLGGYIQQQITRETDIVVDFDYNREGEKKDPKTAYLQNGELKNVVPDIIIHKRGPAGPNILALEVKRTKNASYEELLEIKEIEHDRQKLVGYLKDHNYGFAAHVFIISKEKRLKDQNNYMVKWVQKP